MRIYRWRSRTYSVQLSSTCYCENACLTREIDDDLRQWKRSSRDWLLSSRRHRLGIFRFTHLTSSVSIPLYPQWRSCTPPEGICSWISGRGPGLAVRARSFSIFILISPIIRGKIPHSSAPWLFARNASFSYYFRQDGDFVTKANNLLVHRVGTSSSDEDEGLLFIFRPCLFRMFKFKLQAVCAIFVI